MVVLCHFEIPGFTGGFIGPDIFFVLSGYLITGILYREFSASKSEVFMPGRISMSKFYLKRVRRILPAAFFVLIAVNIYALARLNTLQFEQIKADSIWTVFFAANINFMHQATDYFAQTQDASPLQHYWSLAVEEQFYLIWPMFFLFVSNIRGRVSPKTNRVSSIPRTNLFFALAIAASAIWLIVDFSRNPSVAYFSTFGRVWELALGGVLSLVRPQVLREKLGDSFLPLRWAALAVLLASMALVTPNNFGITLFVPALATGFLLLSGADQDQPDAVNRFLSFPIFVGIGAISYSLYLWHWPLVVFGKQLGYLDSLGQRFLGILVALAISTITYFLIEKPALRIPLYESKRKQMRAALRPHVQQSPWRTGTISFILVAALAYALYPPAKADDSGWAPPPSAIQFDPNPNPSTLLDDTNADSSAISQWRQLVAKSLSLTELPSDLDPDLKTMTKIASTGGFGPCQGKSNDPVTLSFVCESSAAEPKTARTAIILGDSHARTLWPAILRSLNTDKWNIKLLAMPGCPVPVLKPRKLNEFNVRCAEHREKTLRYLESAKPDLVFLNDAVDAFPTTGEYRTAYLKVMPRITAASKYVFIIAKTPKFPNLKECLDTKGSLEKCKPIKYSLGPLGKVQQEIVNRFRTGFWDASEALCTPTGVSILCPAIIGKSPATADGGHLIPSVSESIAPFLRRSLDKQGVLDLADQ